MFFVLSGFLMTGLMIKERKRGDFPLSGFWVRRILKRQVQEVTNQSVELAFVDEFPFPFVRVASDVSCDLLRQHFFVIPDAS